MYVLCDQIWIIFPGTHPQSSMFRSAVNSIQPHYIPFSFWHAIVSVVPSSYKNHLIYTNIINHRFSYIYLILEPHCLNHNNQQVNVLKIEGFHFDCVVVLVTIHIKYLNDKNLTYVNQKKPRLTAFITVFS